MRGTVKPGGAAPDLTGSWPAGFHLPAGGHRPAQPVSSSVAVGRPLEKRLHRVRMPVARYRSAGGRRACL